MEALDRSFSVAPHSDGVLGMSPYPHSPEPQLNPLGQFSECMQPQYSNIQYDDSYQYDSGVEPCSPSTASSTPLETPIHSYSRTPLSSMSSYSSDASSPNYSSQSSGLSEMPSISNLSISSEASSSQSLFQESPLYNPFSVDERTEPSVKKSAVKKSSASKSVKSSRDKSVPRRSSAPARGGSNDASDAATRKDSFIYDVQLDSDNVLLFVPDLVS